MVRWSVQPNVFPTIDVSYDGRAAECRFVGEFDISALSLLRRRLAALPRNGCTRVVFDCTSMTFLDVASARALQLRVRELRERGIDVEIRNMPVVFTRVMALVVGEVDA